MSKIQTFDNSVDLLRAVPWQYDAAVRLLEWLQNKQNYLNQDHSMFWEDWYNDVFNIETCNFFGASVWAIILNLPLLVNLPPGQPNIGWGFGEFRKNFFGANFFAATPGQLLTIEQRRILLKMRYQQIVSSPTIPRINQIMNEAWGDLGDSYVVDNFDMTITYTFDFDPPPWVLYGVQTLQVLPRPSAVDALVSTP